MRFALKELNSKIRLDAYEVSKGTIGYCPACQEKLHNCRGSIKAPYFSYYKGTECKCIDNWDMSEWHRNWQDLFPVETQEFYLKANNKIHRADICYDNIIIEFQHSPIDKEKFQERSDFWINNGYIIIWVFDISECKKEFYNSDLKISYFNFLKRIHLTRENQYIFFNESDRVYLIDGYNWNTNYYILNSLNKEQWHEADSMHPNGIYEEKPFTKEEFLDLIVAPV